MGNLLSVIICSPCLEGDGIWSRSRPSRDTTTNDEQTHLNNRTGMKRHSARTYSQRKSLVDQLSNGTDAASHSAIQIPISGPSTIPNNDDNFGRKHTPSSSSNRISDQRRIVALDIGTTYSYMSYMEKSTEYKAVCTEPGIMNVFSKSMMGKELLMYSHDEDDVESIRIFIPKTSQELHVSHYLTRLIQHLTSELSLQKLTVDDTIFVICAPCKIVPYVEMISKVINTICAGAEVNVEFDFVSGAVAYLFENNFIEIQPNGTLVIPTMNTHPKRYVSIHIGGSSVSFGVLTVTSNGITVQHSDVIANGMNSVLLKLVNIVNKESKPEPLYNENIKSFDATGFHDRTNWLDLVAKSHAALLALSTQNDCRVDCSEFDWSVNQEKVKIHRDALNVILQEELRVFEKKLRQVVSQYNITESDAVIMNCGPGRIPFINNMVQSIVGSNTLIYSSLRSQSASCRGATLAHYLRMHGKLHYSPDKTCCDHNFIAL